MFSGFDRMNGANRPPNGCRSRRTMVAAGLTALLRRFASHAEHPLPPRPMVTSRACMVHACLVADGHSLLGDLGAHHITVLLPNGVKRQALGPPAANFWHRSRRHRHS